MNDVIRAMIGLLAMVAFVIFISTPGGIECGDIAWGEGALRMVLSGGLCGFLLWVIDR